MLLLPVASCSQRTPRTRRRPRMADLASQANGQQMEALHVSRVRRKQRVQSRVGIASFGNESHPVHDPAYVRVRGKDRSAEREQQDDSGCLRPDAGNPQQPRQRLILRQVREEREIERAPLGKNARERGTDGLGFLLLQPARADDRLDLLGGRFGERSHRAESLQQGGEGSIPVHVRRVLRENREDERLDWIFKRNRGCAIGSDKLLGDPVQQCDIVHGPASIVADAERRNSRPSRPADTMTAP